METNLYESSIYVEYLEEDRDIVFQGRKGTTFMAFPESYAKVAIVVAKVIAKIINTKEAIKAMGDLASKIIRGGATKQ